VDNFKTESVDNFDRNRWTTSNGMGGQLQTEWPDNIERNTHSELRPFTLFATIMGERHELGEMPNVNVALQYLKEFPKGPFARDASIILGDFYSDLFKVIGRLQEKEPHDYKYDCFRKHVKQTDLAIQAVNARSLSISYYAKALANAPAGWAETVDVRKRLARMREGNRKLIDEMGWHFCAD
jgi:hypothetical protein